MKRSLFAIILLVGICVLQPRASALQLQTEGRLQLPPGVPVVAVASDFTIQKALGDEIWNAKRNPPENAKTIAVLTVTYDEHLMTPGVSLEDVAHGDTQLLAMLRHTGVSTTPMESSEGSVHDRSKALALEFHSRVAAVRPSSPKERAGDRYTDYAPAVSSENSTDASVGGTDSIPVTSYGAGSPPPAYVAGATPDQLYSKVLIARANLNDAPGTVTVVAMVRAGEDLTAAKKRVAEEIANSTLH